MHPDYFRRAVMLEAEILLQQGQVTDALDNLEHAIAIMPRDVDIVITLANLLSIAPGALRNSERALDLAQRAFKEKPNSAAAESVGLALSASDQCSEAVIWLQRAATLASARSETAVFNGSLRTASSSVSETRLVLGLMLISTNC